MAPTRIVALLCLLAVCRQAASHPKFIGKPLADTYPEANTFTFGTELDVYDRYDTSIMQGIGMHGGDPATMRTVKLVLYSPPVAVPTSLHIAGWSQKIYPCKSEGVLQCDGWHVVEMTANSWEDAVNNTNGYYWDIGFNFKNDCACNHDTACVIEEGENGAADKYKMWFPLVQYMSNASAFPYHESPPLNADGEIDATSAVFWTYDADVQKYGVLKGGSPVLDFSDFPLFINNETGLQGYANGKRAVHGYVTDWSRCDFLEWNTQKIAPITAGLPGLSGLFDESALSGIPAPAAASSDMAASEATGTTQGASTLTVVALAISVVSLLVAIGAIFYAHVKVSNNASANNSPQPLKTVV